MWPGLDELAEQRSRTGGAHFKDPPLPAGPGVLQRRAAPGLAEADIDDDGRLETLVNSQNEKPAMLAQQGDVTGNWVLLDPEGTRSNGSANGARVHLRSKSGSQHRENRGGGSYLSQIGLRIRFGLGENRLAEVQIRWPRGTIQLRKQVEGGRVPEILEPFGGR